MGGISLVTTLLLFTLSLSSSFSSFKNFPVVGLRSWPALPLAPESLEGSGDQRFTYRGVDPDQFLDMNNEQLMELFVCRIRRKFSRGLKRKPMALIKKLRKDEEVRESREADLVSYSDVRWRAIQTCLRHLTTSSLRRLSF